MKVGTAMEVEAVSVLVRVATLVAKKGAGTLVECMAVVVTAVAESVVGCVVETWEVEVMVAEAKVAAERAVAQVAGVRVAVGKAVATVAARAAVRAVVKAAAREVARAVATAVAVMAAAARVLQQPTQSSERAYCLPQRPFRSAS